MTTADKRQPSQMTEMLREFMGPDLFSTFYDDFLETCQDDVLSIIDETHLFVISEALHDRFHGYLQKMFWHALDSDLPSVD